MFLPEKVPGGNGRRPPEEIIRYLERRPIGRKPTIAEIEASIERVNAEIREIRARGPEVIQLEKTERLIQFCRLIGLEVSE